MFHPKPHISPSGNRLNQFRSCWSKYDRIMKRRLLYAEDDEVVRRSLSRVLSHLGWQVVSEADGAAALGRISAEEFDVVLTDHHMPVLGGLGLVENLRARGYTGRIYVLSGALPPAEREYYRRLQVDGIAAKPVTLPELREMLGAA